MERRLLRGWYLATRAASSWRHWLPMRATIDSWHRPKLGAAARCFGFLSL